jgi:FkbM family methyltransferase
MEPSIIQTLPDSWLSLRVLAMIAALDPMAKMSPDINLKTINGWAILPSSLKQGDESPRFNLTFPMHYASDVGALHLIVNESNAGYEVPTRNLIERALRRGDLFVDVGAHWGFFTLQAATHPAGDIQVISFEPELMNAVVLNQNIVTNKLGDAVTLICAACGDQYDLAPLVINSTMGHSIRGVALPPQAMGPSRLVPVVRLDTALACFPGLADRRIILKIDAEGLEPEIIAGAESLIRSGRIAVIVWECGRAFVNEPGRSAMLRMVAALSDCGYRHLRPPTQETDGPLSEFAGEPDLVSNIYSCTQQFSDALDR